MYIAVGEMGVQVYDGEKHYKSYSLNQLVAWGSRGDEEDTPHAEHNVVTLTKAKDGKSAEYITDDANRIVKEISKRAGAQAKQMQKAEREQAMTSTNTEKQGFDARQVGLPPLPEGQRYYKVAKVLRGKDLNITGVSASSLGLKDISVTGLASIGKSTYKTATAGGKDRLREVVRLRTQWGGGVVGVVK